MLHSGAKSADSVQAEMQAQKEDEIVAEMETICRSVCYDTLPNGFDPVTEKIGAFYNARIGHTANNTLLSQGFPAAVITNW